MTEGPEVTFRAVAGDQLKVVPATFEDAVRVAVPKPQISPEFTETSGVGLTVMVMVTTSTLPALSMTVQL